MIKAIIFDMDGVLADTDRTRFALLKKILKKRGLLLSDQDYKKSVGRRAKIFLKEIFGEKLTEKDLDEIYNERIDEFHRHPKKYIVAFPNVRRCIKKLYDQGFVLAIATASRKDETELVLRTLKLIKYFSVITNSSEVKKMKPDPETYLVCLSKLGLSKDECLAIEDSPVGVQAVKNAGIYCVAVSYTYSRSELKMADRIIDSLAEIPSLLMN